MNQNTRAWTVQGMLSAVVFMTLMEANAVNLAIPAMSRALHTGLDRVLWIAAVYQLVLAATMVIAGRLGDLHGPKRMFLAGLGLFAAGSAGCALARNIDVLLAARVVQGLGAALLTPQSLAFTTRLFPPERRGRALGLSGAVAGLGVTAGPTLGGLLVAVLGWRSIFWVNVPIAAAVFALFARLAPDLRTRVRERLDLLGAGLLAGGLTLVTCALLESAPHPRLAALAVPGAALLAAFTAVERRRQQDGPLLHFAVLRNRDFTLLTLATGALPCAVAGVMLLCSMWLQSGMGMSAARAGLTLALAPAVSVPLAMLAGRWNDRFGAKPVTLAGMALMAAGMAWTVASLRAPLPGLAVFGAGMGVVYGGPFTLAIRDIEPAMTGAASGVFSTGQRIGGVLGGAAVGALLQGSLHAGIGTAVRQAFLLPLAALVAAVALTAASSRRTTAGRVRTRCRSPRPGRPGTGAGRRSAGRSARARR
ncbi:MFS transporter [Actinomadura rupiterrae]|uniref:MFS transporter n=1 Tax=Actinomadura rupiterrae TaxID=559627 RepID=UPI0020A34370|nr:MFS transporter [Actinomadura rupiterrae]MCP2343228.1 EmrB/QacA subfamily drug resistance transporter [Actinomadura rupiterrae]